MATSVMTGKTVEAVLGGKGKLMDNLSNYIIVDIGANLTNKKFSRDLDQVIQRATDSGDVLHCTALHCTIINEKTQKSNKACMHLIR